MASIRKTPPRKRPRAKTALVPRPKIPDRVQVNSRVPKVRLDAFDAAWKAAAVARRDPNFNRTDALLEAMDLWSAAEAAKRGAP